VKTINADAWTKYLPFSVYCAPSGSDGKAVRCFSLTAGTSMSSTSIDFSRPDMPVRKWLHFKWSQDKRRFLLKTDDAESSHAPISLGPDEVSACSVDCKVKHSRTVCLRVLHSSAFCLFPFICKRLCIIQSCPTLHTVASNVSQSEPGF
jgi:hypothetical protein